MEQSSACYLLHNGFVPDLFFYPEDGGDVSALHKYLKLRGLSPRANYTDPATAACRPSYFQLLRIGGCRVVSATDPRGRILGFIDRSRYYFFQAAPHLYSRGRVDPVSDPLLLRKSGSAGNRTRTSGSVARNTDH
jgi:hypothetical protein